jgi:hypothetical protein
MRVPPAEIAPESKDERDDMRQSENLAFLSDRSIADTDDSRLVGSAYLSLFGLTLEDIVRQVQDQMTPACTIAGHEVGSEEKTDP